MDPSTRLLSMGAAGAGGAAAKTYVEDVFSTFLYTGNGSTQTITNGIDLSGKGGLVWIKGRSVAYNNVLNDTGRGVTQQLSSNQTDGQQVYTTGLTAFTSTGFSIGNNIQYNESSQTYASWTFRKEPGFFDVVTYTGTGANRTVAHSLGSVPGTIIVKRTNAVADWQVYHRSLANTEYLVLNSTAAKATGTTRWNSTTPTSTEFSLGTDATVNASGGTYVAYLFAHDAGGFGDSGNESVIKCGSFTTDGSGNATVTLGWEPQWLILKETNASHWSVADSMRGFNLTSRAILYPNLSIAEGTGTTAYLAPNSTGFSAVNGQLNYSSTYIYIAIRREPMRTPTDASKVFDADAVTDDTTFIPTGFPVDLCIENKRTGSVFNSLVLDRLRGASVFLSTSSTAAESLTGNTDVFQSNTGVRPYLFGTSQSLVNYSFRRAPGFFDVVAYTGTGVARTVSHNLGVAPELMIVKKRSPADAWVVYANNDNTDYLVLNTTAATVDNNTIWNDTSPTSSVFTVGTNDDVNGNTDTATFIAYLFASCPGVSKVGSYTGTGTTLSVDCGFTNGARFVMIKRTDSTGDWYVWDTARGIIAADDPYILLNSTAAEVTNTDYIDPLSSGFQISSTAPAAINASGGSFIFLAIA